MEKDISKRPALIDSVPKILVESYDAAFLWNYFEVKDGSGYNNSLYTSHVKKLGQRGENNLFSTGCSYITLAEE